MEELINKAKERFEKDKEPNWRLNQHILQISITRFKELLDQGILDSEDQIIRFSLIMATEFK